MHINLCWLVFQAIQPGKEALTTKRKRYLIALVAMPKRLEMGHLVRRSYEIPARPAIMEPE